MTGASMDTVDVILTQFEAEKITDIAKYSKPYPTRLHDDFQEIRKLVHKEAAISMEELGRLPLFQRAHGDYIRLVAQATNELIDKSKVDKKDITAVGFSGQTLDHHPPSISPNSINVYTLQVGSGQMLSDLIGLPVIYDFRSDDIMNGGDGAPFAPLHHRHIAQSLGYRDVIFYNAGNTANLSIVSKGTFLGWDAGPFNAFPNQLIYTYTDRKEQFDKNAQYGQKGKLDLDLLRLLFKKTVIMANGKNFLELAPPKSSDTAWYHLPTVFLEPDHFEDKLYTLEYFSGYVAAHTLKYALTDKHLPTHFVLFGGGWDNPVCRQAFEDLLGGKGIVLPEHKDVFKSIVKRFDSQPHFETIPFSQFMEARLFADLARYFLEKKNWFDRGLTKNHIPHILGVRRNPHQGPINDKINRASKGWQKK